MAFANVETEAKFIIPDQATFNALRQLTHLGQFELKPGGVKTVCDRYLDTGDKQLFQAGLACRLRNAAGQPLITLKALTPASSALHRRAEVETRVKADHTEPDQPAAWEAGQAQKVVAEIIGQKRLQTLFTIHQTRQQFQVCWQGQAVIELSLDEVGLRQPEVVDFRELEAELLEAGSEEILAAFVEALLAQWPLQPQTYSKFEQAWSNAAKKKPKKSAPAKIARLQPVIEYPVRQSIGLEPTDSLAEAGRKVLGYLFGRMLIHEPGARLGNDIEALHDMRVATRRMRAALGVFGPSYRKKAIKPIRAGLRTTAHILGRVRDLDVLLEKLQQYQQTLPEPDQAGLQPLWTIWLAQRDEARREMLAYLGSAPYLRFKQDFLEFVTREGKGAKPIPLGTPVPFQLRHVVPRLIYERFEAVHAYEVVLEHASLDTLHQLRIAFKQFRYALEYFEEILGQERHMVIAEVKILQDHLGNLNDARLAGELLRNFLAEWDERQKKLPLAERQSPAQVAAYLEAKLAERQALIVSFPQAWARFNQPDFRRNLALALAVL